MNQEFDRHPTIKNYEASGNGVVRHCEMNIPVGALTIAGSIMFTAGKKTYHNHRFVYEDFNGDLLKGLVIDHIDGNIKNNYVNNLRVISQRKNCSSGNAGRCKTVKRRTIKSINAITGDEKIFQSINAAGKHFGIWPASVQFVADGIRKSAL